MFIVTTIKGSTYGMQDDKAKYIMKKQLSGEPFVVGVEKKGEIVASIQSHQIAEIIEMEEYKRQYEDRLRIRRQETCPYCANPKVMGQICATCGNNKHVEDRFKNKHFEKLISQSLTLPNGKQLQ